jgi:hypothetical protein
MTYGRDPIEARRRHRSLSRQSAAEFTIGSNIMNTETLIIVDMLNDFIDPQAHVQAPERMAKKYGAEII